MQMKLAFGSLLNAQTENLTLIMILAARLITRDYTMIIELLLNGTKPAEDVFLILNFPHVM